MSMLFQRGRRRIANTLNRLAEFVRPTAQPALDMIGGREIQWSWILAHIKTGPGAALEFGPGSYDLLSLTAAQRGYQVFVLDRESLAWPFVPPGITFKQGDILMEEFPANHFDLIINCSAIEHVGLAGRYGTTQSSSDGDVEAMRRLSTAIKPDGIMLLTIPVGQDSILVPWHRVYGAQRLPLLLEGWRIIEECYWVRMLGAGWNRITQQQAVSVSCNVHYSALGCFAVEKKI